MQDEEKSEYIFLFSKHLLDTYAPRASETNCIDLPVSNFHALKHENTYIFLIHIAQRHVNTVQILDSSIPSPKQWRPLTLIGASD